MILDGSLLDFYLSWKEIQYTPVKVHIPCNIVSYSLQ